MAHPRETCVVDSGARVTGDDAGNATHKVVAN
jgi:hypothetical protein